MPLFLSNKTFFAKLCSARRNNHHIFVQLKAKTHKIDGDKFVKNVTSGIIVFPTGAEVINKFYSSILYYPEIKHSDQCDQIWRFFGLWATF